MSCEAKMSEGDRPVAGTYVAPFEVLPKINVFVIHLPLRLGMVFWPGASWKPLTGDQPMNTALQEMNTALQDELSTMEVLLVRWERGCRVKTWP
jgi:hypothetical protein